MLEVASPEQNPVDETLHHLAEKLASLPEDQAASIAPDFERLKQLIAEQASQQEEARRQNRQAEMFSRALSEINQIIHSSLEIDEILDGAVSAAARAIGSDSAALSLRKGQRWVVSSIYQFPEDVLGSTMDDEEERHAVLAIESQAPVAISDAYNDPRVNNEHMRQWGIASVLVVPVILRGRPLGVIFFNFQHGMAEFEEAHLDFAAKLAASISLAIQNADLFQSLKQGIIERERAEEALRASEKRLRVALSSLDIFVYSLDRDLRYTWVYNERIRFPIPREQILGKRDDEIFPPEAIQDIMQMRQRVIDTGQGNQGEVKVKLDGEWQYYLVSLEPLRDASGAVIGLNGASLNVTHQHKIEAERREAIIEREIHHRISDQREKERQSYARDLHDGPIQTLSSLSFSLQFVKETYPNPALRHELDLMTESVQSAVQELRDLINELRPPSVIRFGLSKALQVNQQDLRERCPGIDWRFTLDAESQILPEQTNLALYRIYQEAINNIIRHSQATRAWVTYHVRKDRVTLEIRDNGVGFANLDDIAELTQSNHFGLAGISERVEAIGGEYDLHSEPGSGTRLRVWVKTPR